jgi:hypothetical protein
MMLDAVTGKPAGTKAKIALLSAFAAADRERAPSTSRTIVSERTSSPV